MNSIRGTNYYGSNAILIGIFDFWGDIIFEFLKKVGEIREIFGVDG